ncbi:hypothetical protein E4U28_008573 [Claviceps purpurea]|nr:hypothetical protein E4U28_008573 [Claviceps purpurea]
METGVMDAISSADCSPTLQYLALACQAISVLQMQHAIRSAEFHASQDTRKMRDMSEVTHFQLPAQHAERVACIPDQSTDKTRSEGHQDFEYLPTYL